MTDPTVIAPTSGGGLADLRHSPRGERYLRGLTRVLAAWTTLVALTHMGKAGIDLIGAATLVLIPLGIARLFRRLRTRWAGESR